MTRQFRRKQIRDLEKEYKKILNSRIYKGVTTEKVFDTMSVEDLELLRAGKYENESIQARFQMGQLLFSRLKQINERMNYLRFKGDLKDENK
jgi:hypothetical protein